MTVSLVIEGGKNIRRRGRRIFLPPYDDFTQISLIIHEKMGKLYFSFLTLNFGISAQWVPVS